MNKTYELSQGIPLYVCENGIVEIEVPVRELSTPRMSSSESTLVEKADDAVLDIKNNTVISKDYR